MRGDIRIKSKVTSGKSASQRRVISGAPEKVIVNFAGSAVDKRKKRQSFKNRQIKLFVLAILLFVANLAVGLWYLPQSDKFAIADISIVGGSTSNLNKTKLAAEQYLSGRILSFVSRRSTLTYGRDELREFLLEDNVELSAAQPVVSGNLLQIAISERSPKFVYCGEREGGEACYYADDSGFMFRSAPRLTGNLFFTISEVVYPQKRIGSYIVYGNELSWLKSVVNGSKKRGIIFTEATKKGSDFDFRAKEGYMVKFTYPADPNILAERLLAVISSVSKERKSLKSLEYIDMRFGNKIYFKEKTASAPTVQNETRTD